MVVAVDGRAGTLCKVTPGAYRVVKVGSRNQLSHTEARVALATVIGTTRGW
jgi:hypothetical protein